MVERRSPKPEVGGSIPSAPARKEFKKMFNPLKFVQGVKQEAFKVTWPTKKTSFAWIIHGFCISNYRSNIFLVTRSNL